MSASSYGEGRYHAAEADLRMVPRINLAGTARGALWFHGAGGSAPLGIDEGDFNICQRLARTRPVVSADYGGTNTWGNTTSRDRTEDARTYLGTVGAINDKIHLIAGSMGCLTALGYAKNYPSRVQSITLLLPVVDMAYVYANNVNGARAPIEAAWGVTYPTLPTDAQPLLDTTTWDAFPLKAWYVTDDIFTPAASSVAFVGACAQGTLVNLGALGHNAAAFLAVPPADVEAFIVAND